MATTTKTEERVAVASWVPLSVGDELRARAEAGDRSVSAELRRALCASPEGGQGPRRWLTGTSTFPAPMTNTGRGARVRRTNAIQGRHEVARTDHRREVRVLMLCSEAGCTEEATTGHRCRIHERERNRRHRSEHKPIYNTRKWHFTRRRVLFERPLCERCGEVATDVHHRDGYDAPYNLDGLEPLCHPCHSRVTRAEQLAGGLQKGGSLPGRLGGCRWTAALQTSNTPATGVESGGNGRRGGPK